MKEIFNKDFTKIFKIYFIAIFIFFISNLLFATEHYIINTSSVILNQNFCFFYNQSNTYPGDGGVIFNNNGNITISSCTFVENKNLYQSGFGGAIYNDSNGDIVITSTLFNRNSAIELSTSYYTEQSGLGGAICNYGKIIISSTIFSENQAQGKGYGNWAYNAFGGAIRNENKGEIIISSTVISENIATAGTNKAGIANGGAISNSGKITLIDGVILKNNSVTGVNAFGGAIFNSGIVNLIANTGNIEFIGNTVNGVSNAIHDSGRTINLYASENANIIFNDRITSTNNTSILNVNSSTTTLNAVGKIILNEDMSGYLGTVNLYCGEIELQAKTNGINNINTNKFFSGNINLSSGTLNILNNAIDNITVSTLTTTVNANLKIDVNLSNNTSDNFTVINTASGELNLIAINILGIEGNKGEITLFNNEKSPKLNILTTGNYGGDEYVFTNNEIAGVLNYLKKELQQTFKEVVNDMVPKYRSYSLVENEIVTETLGNLGGIQLTIFGNNKNIIGSNLDGIFVASDKILNIENVNNWSGFNNIYGAVKNEGALNITGTNFNNNEGQDIINNGILILTGISSSFEKGIIGTGTITISGININLANAIIEQNKIEIKDNGSLTVNASNLTTNIENNSSLIFIEGTNSNYIFGSGITTIDGSVINSSTIANNIKINSSKQLTTNAENINKQIENNGSLIFNSGTNNNQIIGTGTTIIDGNVTNNSTITNAVTINQNKQLTTSATNIKKNIQNNGNLVFNAGSNSNQITGTGTTIIDGIVTNNSSITNAVKINIQKQLTTNASNIKGNVKNDGILIFNAGTNSNIVTGTGLTQIYNNVKNEANITQNNLEILANKQLTNTSPITINELLRINSNAKIINNSNLLINNGTNNGNIERATNTSAVTIQGDFTNNGTITSATTIQGKFINNGMINYILTIEQNGEFINNNQITASIKNNGVIKSNANNINGEIQNNEDLIFIGGINNNHIYGTGKTIIDGSVTNNSTITNAVTINQDKQLTTSATNINGQIENNGNLIFNSGTEINNRIIGLGILKITGYNLTNNEVINQKEILIHKTVNMETVFGNEWKQYQNIFTNNSEISAETITLSGTVLKLTEKGVLKIDNLHAGLNSAMDLANNKIQHHNFKSISMTDMADIYSDDDLNLSVDVDLANKQMDTINADSYVGKVNININEINLLTELKGNKAEIEFTTSTALKNNITSINKVNSKLFKYNVEYNKNAGTLNFSVTVKDNPNMVAGQIANVSGLITQTTVLYQAFASMENIKSRILQVKNEITDESPLYASTANTIFFQKTNRIESGLWLRPFYSQETVNLDNLSVDNTLTGTLAGLDLATGENSLVSVYLGYAGSEQKYENIKVSQTGYILGATGMLVKEQWYAGLTANINFNKAESQSSYGTDNFDMNMYSVGAKAGYNFDLSDKWTLEPNLMLLYGNVNSQEYQTTQGAKIEGQSIANIIFEPQVKAKLNLENGWQPYGLIGYVVNAGDKVTTKVEEVEFDGKKIGNYVEFGAGIDKSFKNSPWSLYIQLTGRSGDRTGFDGNFGIKYSFLTAKEKKKISKIKKIQVKRKAKEEFLREKKRAELKEQQEIEEENKRIQQEEQEEQRRLEIQRRIKANYEE